jgi:hypothetical protein
MNEQERNERDKARFWNLVRRYNRVAEQLPSVDEVTDDPAARSTAILLIAELREIQAKIDSFKVR